MNDIIYIEMAKGTYTAKNRFAVYVKMPLTQEIYEITKNIDWLHFIPELQIFEVAFTNYEKFLHHFKSYTFSIPNDKKHKSVFEITKRFKEMLTRIETAQYDFVFKTKPYQHQLESFEYAKTHSQFLLSDDQGLGKTKQSIDIAVSRKNQFKHCLIICGVNSLKWNWKDEIKVHSDEKSIILGTRVVTRGPNKGQVRQRGSSKKLEDLISNRDEFFIITNIESLREPKIKDYLHQMIEEGEIGMVIIDEIHKALSHSSIVGEAIHSLNSYYKIALTGTPLMNSPLDFYNIFVWLGEQQEKTYRRYCIRYSETDMWTNQTTYKNLDHLRSRLDRVQLRRLKTDVVDLPPKVHKKEFVELDARTSKLYYEIREQLIREINDIVISPNPLASLIRLRQVTGCPFIFGDEFGIGTKLERLKEIVDELMKQNYKVIIFSNWSAVINGVENLLSEYKTAKITGDVQDSVRMQSVNEFQKGDTNIIMGTIGAMGTGLTLNKAEYVIFIDEPWNSANKVQAEDRAHRIGTENTVYIITLLTKYTIDEKINEIVYSKKQVGDYLVDGIEFAQEKRAKDYIHDLLGLIGDENDV